MCRENLEQLISMYKTYIDLECEIKQLWFEKVSRECQYFYHKFLKYYGYIQIHSSDILSGEICCQQYYINNFNGEIPTISRKEICVDFKEFYDEIEILSKEDFVSGLKKALQDALDNM